jgi:hypothetical protein
MIVGKKDKEKENMDNQIDVYLKIAHHNFKLKYYNETLECLENLDKTVQDAIDANNVII